MGWSRHRPPNRSLAALVGLILLAALLRLAGLDSFSLSSTPSPEPAPTRPSGHEAPLDFDPASRAPRERNGIEARKGPEPSDPAVRRLARAFAERESGFMVTFEGEITKVLADDREGSRHQRFLVRVAGGDQTLLVAHNIDLAERVPVASGDRIRLRGQYEWNDLGGVLHWTHHDPGGRRAGGFIEADGRRFE